MSNEEQSINMIKFVIIGDKSVGKTSIITRLVKDKFEQEYQPTSIIDTNKYRITTINNYVLKIVDTPGSKQFSKSIIKEFDKTNFIFIVFDITNKNSFDSVNGLINDCELHKNRDKLQLILIGNKSDLEQERKVKKEEAKQFAEEKCMKYYETSALNKENIQKIFDDSVNIYIQSLNYTENNPNTTHTLNIESGLKININRKGEEINGKNKNCCICSIF